MADARKKAWTVSIHLAKSKITKREDCLRSTAGITSEQAGAGRGSIGTLYYRRTPSKEPNWIGFFDGLVDTSKMRTSSVAATLLIKRKNRWFALTFGYGASLLESNAFEEDFGLKVTLNSIDAGSSIRCVDKATIDAQGRHGREQTSQPTSISEFGLNVEQDILRAVTGVPKIKLFGKQITGRDCFVAHPTSTARTIGEVLDAAIKQYGKTTYKTDFPWVDHIQEVVEQDQKNKLDEKLSDRIINGNYDKLWMSVPEVIEWDRVSGFSYSTGANADEYVDLHIKTLVENMRSVDNLTADRLRQKRVVAVDAANGTARHSWPVYRCIYCEITDEDNVYLLNNGKWYCVEQSYLTTVNRSIGQIPSNDGLELPDYEEDEDEASYNERVVESDPDRFALMDRKNIAFGGGGSRIEFCDVYDKDGVLVHVKKYGGSSVLSHLFQQGVVSASLLLQETEFRKLVNKELPARHQIPVKSSEVSAGDYEIAFVIISRSTRKLELPFFSKVSLRVAYRNLRTYGFKVTMTKVQALADDEEEDEDAVDEDNGADEDEE